MFFLAWWLSGTTGQGVRDTPLWLDQLGATRYRVGVTFNSIRTCSLIYLNERERDPLLAVQIWSTSLKYWPMLLHSLSLLSYLSPLFSLYFIFSLHHHSTPSLFHSVFPPHSLTPQFPLSLLRCKCSSSGLSYPNISNPCWSQPSKTHLRQTERQTGSLHRDQSQPARRIHESHSASVHQTLFTQCFFTTQN
jgi:hypothetical protein